MINATTWMNLQNLMLSKETRQKRPILILHLYEMRRISKSIETESKFMVAWDWGRRQ